MTIFNFGSINADHFYDVPHLPEPGETLAATGHRIGLGGKGANQSVAAARAGSDVVHIGMIGRDGRWARDRLQALGVNTTHVDEIDTPTAHAIINVDATGENAIVIFSGANALQSPDQIAAALAMAKLGDLFLLQNETSLQKKAAAQAQEKDLRVIYSAAPFEAQAARDVLPYTDILVVNEVEAEQLVTEMGVALQDLPVASILITRGAEGSVWHDLENGDTVTVPAFPVTPVDTTGAGDCFIGYVAAGLDQGMERTAAMRLGAAAAAIKVTRAGTADVIPARREVDAFLAGLETK